MFIRNRDDCECVVGAGRVFKFSRSLNQIVEV